ncbi:hypothetical protein ACOSQ2_032716 [Xanthoceras sorbifolium]
MQLVKVEQRVSALALHAISTSDHVLAVISCTAFTVTHFGPSDHDSTVPITSQCRPRARHRNCSKICLSWTSWQAIQSRLESSAIGM